MLRASLAASLFILVASTIAASAAEPPDRSILRWECTVHASIDDAWRAVSTREGCEKWMAPLVEVDFRIGGTIRTNYDKAAGIGGPGTIVHHIMAIEPKRMYCMRFDAPETAKVAKVAEAAWHVMRLEPLAPDRTRIIYTGCGWGEGPEWEAARAFFDKGNAWTLQQFRKLFDRADEAAEEKRTWELARRLCGGEWVHEGKSPDGKIFRVRNVLREAMDGQAIQSDGWLGDESAMRPHALTTIARDPRSEGLYFWSVGERGARAEGALRSTDDKTLVWHWNEIGEGGKTSAFRIEMVLDGRDAYQMRMFDASGDGGAASKPVLDLPFRRAGQAAAEQSASPR